MPSPLRVSAAFCLAIFFLFSSQATAHKSSESYVYLDVTENSLAGRFELAAKDLDALFDVDTDGDDVLSAAEIEAKKAEIYSFFQPKLSFVVNEKPVAISFTGYRFLDAGFATFIQLDFTTPVSKRLPDEITVKHVSYFSEDNAPIRTLLLFASNSKIGLEENEATHSFVFENGTDERPLSLVRAPAKDVFLIFLDHGIANILFGLDHVAFFLALLLSSVLFAVNGKWQAVDGIKPAVWNVVKIIVLLAVAHCVALFLTTLGIIKLPASVIEPLIAATIMVAALANIFVLTSALRWFSVFVMGLLHGLGLADALVPLGVAKSSVFVTVSGFVAGIEVGQILIVILGFPILYVFRGNWLYVPIVLRGGSIVLLLIGSLWFLERSLGFNIPLQKLI